MTSLRVLGAVELTDANGRELRPILQQPKRLALLVYLALATPRGFHRRDSLLALLWPELDQAHARAALRKSLFVLRQELGDTAIVGRGDDEVRLSDDVVWCDAVAFARALDTNELAEALALYRGDLLPAFHVAEASAEFARWLDDERTNLRVKAAAGACRLADEQEQCGNQLAAREWARRAAQLDPYDERAIRHLIGTLDRQGDRTAAIQAYDAFAGRLRTDLDLSPSEATLALVRSMRERTTSTSETFSGDGGAAVARIEAESGAAVVSSGVHASPTALGQARVAPVTARKRWGPLALVAVGALGAILVVAIRWVTKDGIALRAASPDPAVVAVFPFRVSGPDSVVGSLREGIVDLLGARLDGEVGPRAVDPRAAVSAWTGAKHRPDEDPLPPATLRAAAALGAGRFVLGEIVGDARALSLSATLHDVRGTEPVVRAHVGGSTDSLPQLVDRLAAQLLSLELDEEAPRLSQLTSASPRALRAFLAGRREYRRARFREAAMHYWRALNEDTSFALAALELMQTARWYQTAPEPQIVRARTLAWAGRERLSSRDRASLLAHVGPRYPEVPTPAEQLAVRERAVELAPDRAETWNDLGGHLVVWGEMLGADRPFERARGALERGLAIDSSLVSLHYHLLRLAWLQRDDSAARRHATHLLKAHPDFDRAGQLRWWLTLDRGSDATTRRDPPRLDSLPDRDLAYVLGWATELGYGLGNAPHAAELLLRRAVAPGERARASWRLYFAYLFAGRPKDASRLRRQITDLGGLRHEWQAVSVTAATVSVGDRIDAEASASELAAHVAAQEERTPFERSDQLNDACILGRWHLHLSSRGDAVRYADKLREGLTRLASLEITHSLRACSLELDATLAHMQQRPDADRLLTALDSILKTAPAGSGIEGNLAVARIKEARGDIAGALAAVRRRSHFWNYIFFLDASLREEARLATMLGDRDGAVRAWRHYLALRSKPEPSVVPEVRRARRVLDSLLATGAR